MTPLASKIYGEVKVLGAISFARFMELALYSPELGYYERQKEIGRQGDFYTSVSVGNLFGELLAFQFAEWFDECEAQNVQRGKLGLRIIESGAHNGQLASDILNWIKEFRPTLFEQLEYCLIESSALHRDWQRETLLDHSQKISWCADWSEFPRSTSTGPQFTICFSNELFDAMPVHRFGWDAKSRAWFEWGVGWDENNFVWKRLSKNQRSSALFPQLAPELLEILPDGFMTETCPAAATWWKEAASNINFGKLLAIDYGLLAENFFSPQRSAGTLRAYFQHHANSDLLARPGEQDLTAHVNFSALKEAGEKTGLKTDAFVSQAKFLTGIVARTMSRPKDFGAWDTKRAKQLQTLAHPEHLGSSFRVLVQSRR